MTLGNAKSEAPTRVCPDCGGESGLREILYGLPDGPPDSKLYRLGGCCVNEEGPNLTCVSCGWKGSTRVKWSGSDE